VEPLQNRHILIVRTDRIGDVILTLPVVAALRAHEPRARISMLVREYTRELVEGQSGVSGVIVVDDAGVRKPFVRLLRELREAKVDIAIVAFPRFRIAALLWLAGIPLRVGTGYRWYSFLFNRRVFEHRKTGSKSEASYNLGLLEPLGCPAPSSLSVSIRLSAHHRRSAQALRRTLAITGRDRLAIIHPGSGGSARNWPVENFSALAKMLAERGCRVVVAGTESERPLVERMSRLAGSRVMTVIGGQSLMEYAALIESAAVFIANSTGPLHLAAAVGVPVIGFYPNDRVMGPVRWGPLAKRKTIFVAHADGCEPCATGTCTVHQDMGLIPVQPVFRAAMKFVGQPLVRRTAVVRRSVGRLQGSRKRPASVRRKRSE
jgi:lipopolysaccharide heptosyltransferase II